MAVKPTLFVVEDDPDISRLVRHHLEAADFIVRVYPTGNVLSPTPSASVPRSSARHHGARKRRPRTLPHIRQMLRLASVPVIFLTAKGGEADRILGLELGADDYIPKPFSPRELVARVKAVMRRFERPLPLCPPRSKKSTSIRRP